MNVVTWARDHLRDPLRRRGYIIMLNTALMTSLGFAGWFLVARFLPASEYGAAVTVVSVVMLLSVVSKVGIDVLVLRASAKREIRSAHLLAFAATVPPLVAGALALALLLVGRGRSDVVATILTAPHLALVFVATAILWTAAVLLDNLFLGVQRPEHMLAKNTVLSVVKVGAFLPLLFLGGVVAVVGGWAIAAALAFAVGLLIWARTRDRTSAPALSVRWIATEYRQLGGGAYVANLFQTGLGFVLPLIIAERVMPSEAGYFYTVWMITGILLIVPSSFGQSLFSELARDHANARQSTLHALRMTYFLLAIGLAAILLLGYPVLSLFGPGFASRSYLTLVVLATAAAAGGCTYLYLPILALEKRTFLLVLTTGSIFVVAVVGSITLTPRWGIIGSAASYAAAQVPALALIVPEIVRGMRT